MQCEELKIIIAQIITLCYLIPMRYKVEEYLREDGTSHYEE